MKEVETTSLKDVEPKTSRLNATDDTKVYRLEKRIEYLSKRFGMSYIHHALVDVFDTAEFCKEWFESRDITPNDMAIVEMTKLVIDRCQHLHKTADKYGRILEEPLSE